MASVEIEPGKEEHLSATPVQRRTISFPKMRMGHPSLFSLLGPPRVVGLVTAALFAFVGRLTAA